MRHFSVFFLLPFLFSIPLYSQILGGTEPFKATPGEVKPNELSIGSVNGNVNLFTGDFQSSVNLGTVSTPGGLSYSVDLNYNSKNHTGNNLPHLDGIPYGEGWNVSIPRITVQTVSRRYSLPYREYGWGVKRKNFSNDSLSDEGEVFYYAPFLELPGHFSGRLILKEIVGNKAVFIPEKFEKYLEAQLQGTVWTVKLDDGTTYVFDYMQKKLWAASNNRLDSRYKDCLDRDTILVLDTVCVSRDSVFPMGKPFRNCTDSIVVKRYRLMPCKAFSWFDLGNPIREELAKVITPRTEVVSWYPSFMYNPRPKNQ